MTRTNMKKFIGSIKRSSVIQSRGKDNRNGALDQPLQPPEGDHPEAVVVREVMAFCEAGAPGSPSAGDEYLHLPAIVDAAESSPYAAREAALCIQRYLSKQNYERGYAQYNSIMLMRILTDNPGRGFTQNFDKSFVSTFKTLLRDCRDSSVQQIARETLDYFEVEKLNNNDTLAPLVEMWRKEKGGAARMYSTSARSHSNTTPYSSREHRNPRGLPPPEELSGRIEEARTSARLLIQMVQSTPQDELVGNELIKEFAERARQAHKSVQHFMACENPAPDENTMLTLIETSEQLGVAMNKHQRAMLSARKAAGSGSANITPQPQTNPHDPFSTATMNDALPRTQPASQPPPQPPRPQTQREELDLYGSSRLAAPQPPQPRQQYPQYNSYNQHEEQDLYGNSGRVSPIEPDERPYRPPPGPPPTRRQDAQPYRSEPVSPARNEQSRYNTGPSTRFSQAATRDYDVSENPFTDENGFSSAAQAPSSQPYGQQYATSSQPAAEQKGNSFSLFSRAAGQLRDPQSPTSNDNRTAAAAAELDSSNYPTPPPQSNRYSPQRPGPAPGPGGYHADWQPTPSFVQRQDSSAAHITMSGASPPDRS